MNKKIICALLTLALLLGSSFTVLADEKNEDLYSFDSMLERLYDDSSDFTIYKETENGNIEFSKDEFIFRTANCDLDTIKNYLLQESLIIYEDDTDSDYFKEKYGDNEITVKTKAARAVGVGTYRSGIYYKVIYGTSDISGQTIKLPLSYRIRITANYVYSTGKVTGTLRAPAIEVEGTDGVADECYVTVNSYNASITNSGYSVTYSNIKYTANAFNSILWQTYSGTHSGSITMSPADY